MQIFPKDDFKKLVNSYGADSRPDQVLDIIDQAIFRGVIAVIRTNENPLPGTQSYDKISCLGVGVEPAIGTIQNLFGKSGISLVMCGEDHRYKDDAPVQPKLDAMVEALNTGDTDGWSPRLMAETQSRAQAYAAAQNTYQTDLAHYNTSMSDYRRALSLCVLSGGGEQFPKPGLTVVERRMQYDPPGPTARETDLIKQGFSNKQRSALIAAYIFLCVAGGDQGGNDRVLIFFGEEHADILDQFEYMVRNSIHVTWLNKRKRNYGIIASHVR